MKSAYIMFTGIGIMMNISAQSLSAKIELVEGIVIHKYYWHDEYRVYCEAETQIICNNDTVPLHPASTFNLSLLKKYPYLKDILGNPADYDYDYLFDLVNGIFKNDLTLSDYNLLRSQDVFSCSFYYKLGSGCDLYTAYQFKGWIVSYTGDINISFYCYLPPEEYIEGYEFYHLCPKIMPHKKFAVLKEAICLKDLTDKQMEKYSLTKAKIESVHLFYYE